MIIVLGEDCPIFQSQYEAHLQHLLYVAVGMRWHIIASPRPDRLRQLLPPHLWQLYGEFLGQSQKVIVNSPQKWVSHHGCGGCDPARVAAYYGLPFALIVENRHTDGRWIKLVAHLLRPRLKQVFQLPHPRVSIRQAGGIGEIPKELKEIAAEYQASHPGGNVPLSVMALADSDATAPGKASASAREVEKTAAAVGATAHILNKRSIENYVPDDALLEFASKRSDRRGACEHILSLAADVRDYFPMKEHMGDFMDDFLNHFSHAVTAAGLRARDGIGELEELLDKLELNL